MDLPDDLRYTAEHAWIRPTADAAVFRCGITDHAQGELGDIVYLNFPSVGAAVTAGLPYGSIEAVKTVSELYSPLTGTVTALNTALEADPALVNKAPYGDGWIVELRAESPAAVAALLDAAGYRTAIGA